MTHQAECHTPVRVLIVDDSAFMRLALSHMIANASGLEVVATACNGSEALDKIASLDPDVVTLDVEMPGLDGLQTLRHIMNQFPRPVIMVSGATEQNADSSFNAVAAGAFDYIPKRLSPNSLDILHIQQDLVARIRAAAQSMIFHSGELASRKPPQASHGELIQPGVVYIAPAGVHMTVRSLPDSRAFLCLDTHPEDRLHIPSVDVMMTSVAEAYRDLALGVIMTGMGSDGAAGMNAIHRHGGLTIGQDEASCTVYGMPRVCAELGILTRVVPLSQIPAQILNATHYRKHA